MIKILDVTLRDGGRAINYDWGKQAMSDISRAVAQSGCDLIELGCLRPDCHQVGRSLYTYVEEAQAWVDTEGQAEYTLMIDFPYPPQYDLTSLTPYDGGKIRHIRVTFKEGVTREVLEYVRQIIDKGYNLHVNLTCFPNYTHDEQLRMLDCVNELGVKNVTLADTYGELDYETFAEMCRDADEHIDPRIALGLHLHDNSLSAYSLAQVFMHHYGEKRDVIIDASIGGLGKTSGNPHLEMLMTYVNKRHGGRYDMSRLLDVADKYILPSLKKSQEDFSTIYYSLAAVCNMVPSLAKRAMSDHKTLREFYEEIRAISVGKGGSK